MEPTYLPLKSGTTYLPKLASSVLSNHTSGTVTHKIFQKQKNKINKIKILLYSSPLPFPCLITSHSVVILVATVVLPDPSRHIAPPILTAVVTSPSLASLPSSP